jgi:sigma-B regulation protein RsbU (phosphoserine phosphatase)
VGLDVTIGALAEQILRTRIGQHGHAFAIDRTGLVVVKPEIGGDSPWGEMYQAENLLEDGPPELRALAKAMLAGRSGVESINLRDGEAYVAYTPTAAATGWSIGVAMPVGEIVAPARATEGRISEAVALTRTRVAGTTSTAVNEFVVLFVVVLVVVAGITFGLSRTITRRLLKLSNAAQLLESGQLSDDQIATLRESKGRDEVASLMRVFAGMAVQVRAREERLRQQVQDLRIEIDHSKKERQVAEITETDYFQELQGKVRQLRVGQGPSSS